MLPPFSHSCVCQAWLQVIKFAHSKIGVDKQTLVNIWATKCKACLYLLPVVMWDSLHCYLPFERTFELQQENGVCLVQKVTVGAARHFFVKRRILCKIQRNTVAKNSHAVLLLEVFSRNRLEKSAPCTGGFIVRRYWPYRFLENASAGFKR